MELKKLVKNTSLLFSTRIVQFLGGVITTKISAVLLGTTGIGVVNQLSFLTQKMSQLTTLSMSEAVVKQIAENRNNERLLETINSSFKSYIVLVLSFLFLSLFILIVFSHSLTIYVFGEITYIKYFFVGMGTFPILIFSSIPFAILKAFKDVRTISKARILITLINLVIAMPLIYSFKLDGAIVFIPISYTIDLIFHYNYARLIYFKRLKINIKSIWDAKFITSLVSEQLLFSKFGLTVGVYTVVSDFVCRSIVVSSLGIEKIGLYSPIIMWANFVTGLFLPALSLYLYPRFCEIKKNIEISGLINDSLRLGSFTLLPLLFIGIPFRENIIALFFSNEFVVSEKYLPFHFIGVVFYAWWFMFTQAMTPTGKIKLHGILLSGFYSLDIIVTYIFVNEYGLYGWMLKHIISPFTFFWVLVIYSKQKMDFKISAYNLSLMVYLVAGSLLLIFLYNFFYFGYLVNYFLGPMLLAATFFLLQDSEKVFLIKKIQYIVKSLTKRVSNDE